MGETVAVPTWMLMALVPGALAIGAFVLQQFFTAKEVAAWRGRVEAKLEIIATQSTDIQLMKKDITALQTEDRNISKRQDMQAEAHLKEIAALRTEFNMRSRP